MKRKKKQRKFVSTKNVKYWPYIFCTEEELCIAISKKPVGFLIGRKQTWTSKVGLNNWHPENCIFREKKYIIDFTKVEKGEKVQCPNCGADIDFRLIPSHKRPAFTAVKK